MGGRVEPERRGKRQQFAKHGRKYQLDWLYLQSINSDKHLPQSPFTAKIFLLTTFCFGVYKVFASMVRSDRWFLGDVINFIFVTGSLLSIKPC